MSEIVLRYRLHRNQLYEAAPVSLSRGCRRLACSVDFAPVVAEN
jgi:hypothetical protein